MRDIIIPVIQCEQRDKGSWMEDRTEVPDESIPDLLTPLTAKLRFKYKPKINFIWREKKKGSSRKKSIYSATKKKKERQIKVGKKRKLVLCDPEENNKLSLHCEELPLMALRMPSITLYKDHHFLNQIKLQNLTQ